MSSDHPSVAHLDMDAFFASVELRLRPALRGTPLVIAHDGPRSVVSTASYRARTFGIGSAMPLGEAKSLCPTLTMVSPRMEAYHRCSEIVMRILSEHSEVLEIVGVDEAFMQIPCEHRGDGVTAWANTVRGAIYTELGLPSSIGIGNTKLIAKIGSGKAKPNGVFICEEASSLDLIDAVGLRRLPGIGPATYARLVELGISTPAELRASSTQQLERALGKSASRSLIALAANSDTSPVEPRGRTQQIGTETTFDHDLQPFALESPLAQLISRAHHRLLADGRAAGSVVVKLRFGDGETISRARHLGAATQDFGTLLDAATERLAATSARRPVRLLGVSLGSLSDASQDPLPGLLAPVTPESAPTEPGLLDTAHWGMSVLHDTLGYGKVVGLDGTVVAVLLGQDVLPRLFDVSHLAETPRDLTI